MLKVIVLFAMFAFCLAHPSHKPPDRADDEMRHDIEKQNTVPDAKRALDKRGAVTQSNYKWATSTEGGKTIVKIPYTTTLSSVAETALDRAITALNQKTCVRFVPKTGSADHSALFRPGSGGCSSDIGRRTGEQTVDLGEGCQYREIVLHEMLHLLGFYHEHNRDDRNQYLTIYTANIKDGFQSDITNTYTMNKLGIAYDLKSIMQYSKTKFAKSGLVSMEATSNPGMVLGNINLSPLDVKRINKFYGCSEQNNAYQNYVVTVKTGDGWWDGTNAFLYLQLIAGGASSEETEAFTGGTHDDFESDATETFTMVFKTLSSPITKLKVRLQNNPGGSSFDGWTVDWITVNDGSTTYTFNGPQDLDPGDSVTINASS